MALATLATSSTQTALHTHTDLVALSTWAVAVTASYLGDPVPEVAPKLVTAFLLWRIWRGATWSRDLLIGLSRVSAGLAVGLAIAIALGATGVVTSALVMFALYAGVGVLLGTPPVRGLARSQGTRCA